MFFERKSDPKTILTPTVYTIAHRVERMSDLRKIAENPNPTEAIPRYAKRSCEPTSSGRIIVRTLSPRGGSMKYAPRNAVKEQETRKAIFLYFSLYPTRSTSIGRDTVSSTAMRKSENFVITDTAA